MWVNKESKAWDCKHCGKDGGFLTFLELIAAQCQQAFYGLAAVNLTKSRYIKIATFRSFDIGYNEITDSYTIPIFTYDGNRIHDLRIYKQEKLFSTFSCKTTLLNSHAIAKSKGIVWLCEGEWDGMAMTEMLNLIERNKDCAVAVPGAGTFKPDWVDLLKDKTVNVLYDNDIAGRKGALKVFNFLSTTVKELKFLQWGNDVDKGYDIRDLYKEKKSASGVLDYIEKHLGDIPPGADIDDILTKGKTTKDYTGEGLPAAEVYLGYRKWLHLPDTSIIDILYGTVIANRIEGDPIWLFIVAPPGMTKTEFLLSVSSAKNITVVSKLTPKALVSGLNYSGNDPSLLPKLDGKVLIIKDFTPILGMNQQARDEVLSTLREAYDGNFVGIYGHGERRYKSKFGICAGVTPVIEHILENESSVGERFLRYEMHVPVSIDEQIEYLQRATSNVANEVLMRKELAELGSNCLDYNFDGDINIPKTIHHKLLYLSIWTAMLRVTIERDKFSKEILFKPYKELSTRLSKQFLKLLMGICMFRRISKATENEYDIIKKLARDTVPSRTEDFIYGLYGEGTDKGFTQSEIAKIINLPASTCGRIAENMTMLGVLCSHRLPGLKSEWRFTEEFLKILDKSEVYENN